MTTPGTAPVSYGYDDASRLTQIIQGNHAAGLEYDDAGRRTRLSLPNGVSTEYQYDPASRLIALIYRKAAGLLGDLAYQYDPAGNRIAATGSFARTLLPEPMLTASYDAANRQRVFGDKQMSFDSNGNLTAIVGAGSTTAFAWDARDRLTAVEEPGALATFNTV